MKKVIITLLLILVMCPVGVFADETTGEAESTASTTSFNCGNDGQPKESADDCYKDSGLVSSFANVEYVDCAVPYGITLSELGGTLDKKVENVHEWYDLNNLGGVYSFTPLNLSYVKDKAVGDAGNWENDWTNLSSSVNRMKELYPNLTIQREDVSGANYVEVNGIRYYMAAIGKYFYNCDAVEEGHEWLKTTHGAIFDVILTDGQVFHFIMSDAISETHCVRDSGSLSYYKCTSSDHSTCGTETVTASFTPLVKPFYKSIVHMAAPGQVLELWYGGTAQGYKETSSDNQPVMKYMHENNAHIAYIRRYNLTVADLDTIQLNTGVPKGVSWHMIYGANSAEATKLNAFGNAKALRVGYSEQELSSWVRLAESNVAEKLDDASINNLKGDELTSIYTWKTIVTDSNAPVYLRVIRIAVQLLGVLMLIWSVLLYVSYWLDRTNNLIDINFVSILTLGKLTVGEDEDSTYGKTSDVDKNSKVKVVSHKNIILICFVVILFAVLILTGTLYNLLTTLIYAILELFK